MSNKIETAFVYPRSVLAGLATFGLLACTPALELTDASSDAVSSSESSETMCDEGESPGCYTYSHMANSEGPSSCAAPFPHPSEFVGSSAAWCTNYCRAQSQSEWPGKSQGTCVDRSYGFDCNCCDPCSPRQGSSICGATHGAETYGCNDKLCNANCQLGSCTSGICEGNRCACGPVGPPTPPSDGGGSGGDITPPEYDDDTPADDDSGCVDGFPVTCNGDYAGCASSVDEAWELCSRME